MVKIQVTIGFEMLNGKSLINNDDETWLCGGKWKFKPKKKKKKQKKKHKTYNY